MFWDRKPQPKRKVAKRKPSRSKAKMSNLEKAFRRIYPDTLGEVWLVKTPMGRWRIILHGRMSKGEILVARARFWGGDRNSLHRAIQQLEDKRR